MSDIERMLSRNRTLKLSKSDKKWLSYYVSLNIYLRKKGLRNYFIQNKELDRLILAYTHS